MFNILKKRNTNNLNNNELNFIDDDYEFKRLLLKIKEICGIDLEIKKNTIRQKLIKFCKNHNLISFENLIKKIEVDYFIKQDLFDLITVCETYFYRELKQLKQLIELLKIDKSKRRILCAPSSSGEEVYSILMLAQEAHINDISIVGIDINQTIIQKAKSAQYSKRSLHILDDYLKNKYFIYDKEEFQLKKELFKNARFEVVNVFDKKFLELGKFDVVMSRNMMIYFNEEYKYRLVDNFVKILNYGGLLFAGHADLVPQHNNLDKIYSNFCTYYKKI